MTRVQWNIDDLRERRDQLQALLHEDQSRQSRRKILLSLAGYNALFSYYDVKKSKPLDIVASSEDDEEFEKHIMNYLLGLLEYEYPKINHELTNIIVDSLEPYHIVSDRMARYEIEPCVLTNDDLLTITDNIMKSINVPSFYQEFQEIIDPKKGFLSIEYFKYRNRLLFDGTIVTDHYNNLAYGKILRGNTYADVTTVVHEIFHMLIVRASKNLYSFGKGKFYNEVEGFFGGFLANDHLYNSGIDSAVYIDLDDHDMISSFTTKFVVLSEIANSYYKTGAFKFKDLKESFAKRDLSLPITKKRLHEYVPQDLGEIITESLSYLIALDIYEIYKIDPEKAIYTLKQIDRLLGNNTISDLERLGATFFKDGYANLTKKGHQINERIKTKKKK